MIYQLETSTAFSRRTLLRSAGLATLCSLTVPLQTLAQNHRLKCPNCNSTDVTKNSHSRGKQNNYCQNCEINII
jgi:predicted RNA-binding Zn-ribbon protein involved in translation (DUF1610 family)